MRVAPRIAAVTACAVAAAIVALPAHVSASSSHVRRGVTSILLDGSPRAYAARVEINDSVRAYFLVDTGATDTVISPKLAKELGFARDEGAPGAGRLADGSSVYVRLVTLDEIRIGRASVYDSSAVVLPGVDDTGYDGILGMSFLSHFTFKIDHDEGKLILYERD